jgi:hypothetical protein
MVFVQDPFYHRLHRICVDRVDQDIYAVIYQGFAWAGIFYTAFVRCVHRAFKMINSAQDLF